MLDETQIAAVVEEVVRMLRPGAAATSTAAPSRAALSTAPPPVVAAGVFADMDAACAAARAAADGWARATLANRRAAVAAIRATVHARIDEFARVELAETGLGRLDHKVAKLRAVADLTPGVEDIPTRAFSGDRGLTLEEHAPYGVIGAVTPVTHAIPTLVNNAISILAGGNTVVFNPHPASKRCFALAVDALNRAIGAVTGHGGLIACVAEPTIETGKAMFAHAGVRVILVTGGGAVVKEALKSPKKAITAGPGNPPVVVDATAKLDRAARDIVSGAGFDYNILCIGEKEVFVVESAADGLMQEFLKLGCVRLHRTQIDDLARHAFSTDADVSRASACGGATLNRAMVGKSPRELAARIGLEVPESCPLLVGETGPDHMWVQTEQMMPFIPVVRCRDVDEAIARAVQAEHGYRHTAVIHSLDVDHMTRMARAMDCSIFVKNGPSHAGLGIGGEGHTSFSIASPTGEGLTTARTFTRVRRCTLVDYLRIV